MTLLPTGWPVRQSGPHRASADAGGFFETGWLVAPSNSKTLLAAEPRGPKCVREPSGSFDCSRSGLPWSLRFLPSLGNVRFRFSLASGMFGTITFSSKAIV